MKRCLLITLLSIFFSLHAQDHDEPLGNQPWSQLGLLSKHYSAGRVEKPEAIYAILKDYIKSEASILDIGCGTGISTRQLCKNGFKNVIGVDRDILMLNEANLANKESYQIKYVEGDVTKQLPFNDEQFDVITACTAFHYFANPSSIKEAARVLKPKGYYFVIGSKTRLPDTKILDEIKLNIKRIYDEVGAPPNPVKVEEKIPVADALEGQGFKIIFETRIPQVLYFTKPQYLERVQSRGLWNLLTDEQREMILLKLDQYLDTVLDENGLIRREAMYSLVLAQKVV